MHRLDSARSAWWCCSAYHRDSFGVSPITKCHTAQAKEWLESRRAEMSPVPYFHVGLPGAKVRKTTPDLSKLPLSHIVNQGSESQFADSVFGSISRGGHPAESGRLRSCGGTGMTA